MALMALKSALKEQKCALELQKAEGGSCLLTELREAVVQKKTWNVTNPSLDYYSSPLSHCCEDSAVMNS